MPSLKPYSGHLSMLRPIRPCDIDEKFIQFPCYVQPKIDGVRALNLNERGITGRSLKSFANNMLKQIDKKFSNGLDGELCVGTNLVSSSLCRDTTSFVNSFDSHAKLTYVVFDYITDQTKLLWYVDRFAILQQYIQRLNYQIHSNVDVVSIPNFLCHSLEEFYKFEHEFLKIGYEGIVIRKIKGFYKSGTVTPEEQYACRIKRFTDAEALVVSIEEGKKNHNEQTRNELGYASRTTHADEQEANGMVGTLVCKDITTDSIIRVSPGKMTHEERKFYFENQDKILGFLIKYKHFEKGVKDKPRSATFQCFRAAEDL